MHVDGRKKIELKMRQKTYLNRIASTEHRNRDLILSFRFARDIQWIFNFVPDRLCGVSLEFVFIFAKGFFKLLSGKKILNTWSQHPKEICSEKKSIRTKHERYHV